MSEPIVFISHLRIKPGKLDGLKEANRQAMSLIEATKPGTVAFLGFLTADEAEVSFVHVFPDGEAMARHMEGAADRARAAYEFLEPIGFEIYGQAPEGIVEGMKRIAGSGVALVLKPGLLGGYLRLKAPNLM